MTARLGAVAFTVLWWEVNYQYVKIACTVGQGRESNTIARVSRWPYAVPHIEVPLACHQFVPNALACSVFWSPPDVVHHCGCRFASLRWENSNLGCRWAPKPHEHLPLQRRVPGSFSWDPVVRASAWLHVMNRLSRGCGSLTSYIPLKCS